MNQLVKVLDNKGSLTCSRFFSPKQIITMTCLRICCVTSQASPLKRLKAEAKQETEIAPFPEEPQRLQQGSKMTQNGQSSVHKSVVTKTGQE